MSALWTAEAAAAATGGLRQGGDWVATGVSIDTRSLRPGDLFVALKAARDGHDFVADALAKGAAAALVSQVPSGAEDGNLLVVEDVQQALEALGKAGRARSSAKVIAVTGSVGKTTTKDMLRLALAGQGRTHASVESYNNHWGVPLTLARMPVDTDFAVIEIGMNAPGEIAPLARMAAPHVAIVTTVAAAHLEAFESVDGIAVEKASIYEGLPRGGTAILNADLETSPILMDAATRRHAQIIRFGARPEAEARLTRLEATEAASVAQASLLGSAVLLKLSVPGAHLVMNALAALAAVAAVGGDPAKAILALNAWSPVAGRGTREPIVLNITDGDGIELIDDAFNANPASVTAALDVLAAASPRGRGRRIAVLGDMLELGRDAARLHADLAQVPAMAAIDLVHSAGALMAHLDAALPPSKRGLHRDSADDLARAVVPDLRPGDVLLVKGSKSSNMSRVVDALRKLGQAVADRA
ncbi:MAG: UDP-N-acetylmuramoyl-tripeptide--D-alanyl-D-alanine ligase [Pseudomonadota bacterium]